MAGTMQLSCVVRSPNIALVLSVAATMPCFFFSITGTVRCYFNWPEKCGVFFVGSLKRLALFSSSMAETVRCPCRYHSQNSALLFLSTTEGVRCVFFRRPEECDVFFFDGRNSAVLLSIAGTAAECGATQRN